jgi:hypothetical protein
MAIHKIRFVTDVFFPPKDLFFFSPNIGKFWKQKFIVEIQLIFLKKQKTCAKYLISHNLWLIVTKQYFSVFAIHID